MKRISVLVVDDHPVVRQGIVALLQADDEIEVAGEAADGAQALQMVRQICPAVVLMDLAMPRLNGMDATRRILEIYPQTRVLVLTSYGQQQFIIDALGAGAHGYLLKQSAGEELRDAIKAVFGGQNYYSPSVAELLKASGHAAGTHGLSLRQGQILQLIAEDYDEQEIAEVLGMSVDTVQAELRSLMVRLRIDDPSGLRAAGQSLEAL